MAGLQKKQYYNEKEVYVYRIKLIKDKNNDSVELFLPFRKGYFEYSQREQVATSNIIYPTKTTYVEASSKKMFLQSFYDQQSRYYQLEQMCINKNHFLYNFFSTVLYDNILSLLFSGSELTLLLRSNERVIDIANAKYVSVANSLIDTRDNVVTIFNFVKDNQKELGEKIFPEEENIYWLADIRIDMPEIYWNILKNPEEYLAKYNSKTQMYDGYIVENSSGIYAEIVSMDMELLDER
jgi:hypothetical protein